MERQEQKKKMKRMQGILLIVPLLLGACSTGETTGDFPQGTIPIGFSGNVEDTRTRSAQEYATTADLTNIGVFAYFTNGDFNASTATPNFMYNQKVERANTASPWTYTPAKFWPNNTTDKLTFFAYAPYIDEKATGGSNPSFSGNTAGGYPVLTYTVPAAETSQVDLLAATPMMNQTYEGTSGNVKFTMNHALTKVGVYVKSNDNVTGKKVTAFSITSAKNGTLTYHAPDAGNAGDTGTGWTYTTPTATETFTATATDFAVPDSKAAERKLLATFFLLPKGEGSTFSITYTTPGETSTGTVITQSITLTGQPLPSLDKWTQGTSIAYTIGIEKKQITVTAATHPTWEEGGNGTVTGSFTITYATSPTDPDWGNGGKGTVNGEFVTTHTQSNGAEWTPGNSETVDGMETDAP